MMGFSAYSSFHFTARAICLVQLEKHCVTFSYGKDDEEEGEEEEEKDWSKFQLNNGQSKFQLIHLETF